MICIVLLHAINQLLNATTLSHLKIKKTSRGVMREVQHFLNYKQPYLNKTKNTGDLFINLF